MIKYRKANMRDINELIRLRVDFIQEIQCVESESEINNLKESLLEYFNNEMSNDSFVAWLAEESNRIVATSGLCFYTLPPSYKNISGNVAYIMNMYTEPSFRNKGIASVLFQKTVEEAINRGYKKLCLHATDMGKPIYTKFGFKETANEMVINLYLYLHNIGTI